MSDPFISISGHTLYAPGLTAGARVVDLGANHGGFRNALSLFIHDGVYHAVEANPGLIEALRRQSYASVRHCAVTDGNTPVTLEIAKNDEASSILPLPVSSLVGATKVGSVEIPGRSMDALLNEIPGFLNIVKVDIEGAEATALQTLTPCTLRRVGQITVEFHSHDMFGFDLVKPTMAAIDHLRCHGFLALSFGHGKMDVLLLNREHFGITMRQSLIWRVSLTRERIAAQSLQMKDLKHPRSTIRRIVGRLR